MALTLGINLLQDNRVYIGDTLVTVERIKSHTVAEVKVHTPAMDYVYDINNKEMRDVPPLTNVYMGLGKDTNRGSLVRLMIEAPRNIKIDAGKRRDHEED